jgi:hypothetical protein
MAELVAGPLEEEALGKAFEPRLFRRLLTLAGPYKGYVGGSVAILLLESLTQLAGPLLTGAAIDLIFPSGSSRSSAFPSPEPGD